jgi:hypothetical protein
VLRVKLPKGTRPKRNLAGKSPIATDEQVGVFDEALSPGDEVYGYARDALVA